MTNNSAKEIQFWRESAADFIDPLWMFGGKMRDEVYAWLSNELKIPMRHCVVKNFTIEQCKAAIDLIDRYSRSKQPNL
jgi:hypothetical protein